MAKEIKTYQCEYCKYIYDSKNSADLCESKHLYPLKVFGGEWSNGEDKPLQVQVVMNDGTVFTYHID